MTMAMLTRRAALTGAAAHITIAAGCVASVGASAATTSATSAGGISPRLTELITAVAAAEERLHQHSNDRGQRRPSAAMADDAQKRHNQESNELCEACCEAEHRVGAFPVNSAADLQAKLSFMIEREMFDGVDWSAELLVDASRLAKMEG